MKGVEVEMVVNSLLRRGRDLFFGFFLAEKTYACLEAQEKIE